MELAGSLLKFNIQYMPVAVEYVEKLRSDFREDVDPFDVGR
jgi:hypothetical protein